MVGTFADVVVADAIVKGVPGFDLDLARRALLKDVSDLLHFIFFFSISTCDCFRPSKYLLHSLEMLLEKKGCLNT